MRKLRSSTVLWILLIAALVGADQLIKLWVIQVLKPLGTIPIIRDAVHLTYAENTGAAFSLLEGQLWLFVTVVSVTVLVLLYILLVKKPKSKLVCICLSMIVAGGLGNLIDRLVHGFVVDYIDFRIIHYAIFNFADSCVVVGAVLLCFYLIRLELRESKAKKGQHAETTEDR